MSVPEFRPSPPQKRRSVLDVLDNALLVGVVVVGVLVLLEVVGFIVGTLLFFVRLGVLAAVVYVVARLARRVRS